MTPEQIPIALAPFGQIEMAYTRKHQGTGLGLPLSKRFVEAMGGTLNISSQPNIGTHVELRFPESSLQTTRRDAAAMRA
jgi:signal transduction histidine kinase